MNGPGRRGYASPTPDGTRRSKAKRNDSTVTGTGSIGAGVRGDVVKLIAAVVTGNGGWGVEASKRTAQESTVTGNGTDPGCGVTAVCADLSLERHPATHNFGVCAFD